MVDYVARCNMCANDELSDLTTPPLGTVSKKNCRISFVLFSGRTVQKKNMASFSDGCATAHVKFSNDASLMESSGRVGRERGNHFWCSEHAPCPIF